MNSNNNEQPRVEQQYLDLYNLPFTPNMDDIIYFDGTESIKVEKWRIEFFLDDILKQVSRDMEFIDLEQTPQALFKVFINIIHNNSFWSNFSDQERRRIEREMISPVPGGCLRDNDKFRFVPSFLVFERKKGEEAIRFRRYPITVENPPQQVLVGILEMFKKREELDGKIFARKMDQVPDQNEYTVKKAFLDAKAAINHLRRLGVSEFEIKQLLVCDDQPFELHILNNGRFFAIPRFKEYGDKAEPAIEIRLSPLEKAVYLLFLNHPEGIMFSYLPDHREELMRYYRQLMNYRSTQEMIKSVEDVTDPIKNSINEKCARIRRVFMNAIGEENVDFYCVTGTRNSPKGIRLDRNLVHCQIQ